MTSHRIILEETRTGVCVTGRIQGRAAHRVECNRESAADAVRECLRNTAFAHHIAGDNYDWQHVSLNDAAKAVIS